MATKTQVCMRRRGWLHVGWVDSDTELKQYEIKRAPDGAFGCACMGYVFSKTVPKTCKHLSAFYDAVPLRRPHAAPTQMEAMDRVVVQGETFTVRRAISFGPLQAGG